GVSGALSMHAIACRAIAVNAVVCPTEGFTVHASVGAGCRSRAVDAVVVAARPAHAIAVGTLAVHTVIARAGHAIASGTAAGTINANAGAGAAIPRYANARASAAVAVHASAASAL